MLCRTSLLLWCVLAWTAGTPFAQVSDASVPEATAAALRDAIRNAPDDPHNYFELARLAKEGADFEEAQAWIRAAKAISKESELIARAEIEELLLQDALQRAREASPESSARTAARDAMEAATSLLRQEEDLVVIAAEFERAIALDPSFADPRYDLGVLAERSGDTPAAIRWYLQYIALAPDMPYALTAEARIQKLAGTSGYGSSPMSTPADGRAGEPGSGGTATGQVVGGSPADVGVAREALERKLAEVSALSIVFDDGDTQGSLQMSRDLLTDGDLHASRQESGEALSCYSRAQSDLDSLYEQLRGRIDERVTSAGETRLHKAVHVDSPEAIVALVSAGADVDAWSTEDYVTPLQFAAIRGSTRCMQALLDGGADIDLKTPRERHSAVFAAVKFGQLDALRLLVERGASLDGDYWTPLGVAAAEGNMDIVRFLLDEGVDVDEVCSFSSREKSEDTPLHHATRSGQPEIVEILLSFGADPNLKNVHDRAPLHIAAMSGDVDSVQVLLEGGANVNLRTEGEYTALAGVLSVTDCGPSDKDSPELPFRDRGYLSVAEALIAENPMLVYGSDLDFSNMCGIFEHVSCEGSEVLRYLQSVRVSIMKEDLGEILARNGWEDVAFVDAWGVEGLKTHHFKSRVDLGYALAEHLPSELYDEVRAQNEAKWTHRRNLQDARK